MITPPANDRACLSILHRFVHRWIDHPVIISVARIFRDKNEIVAYYQSRTGRVDSGDPLDGPRVACVPDQRLRLLPDDPNCFEATAHYLLFADIIDPVTPRSSVTVRTRRAQHTFPIERGQPVVLDRVATADSLRAQMRAAGL